MPKVLPPIHSRFKPGQSGNPSGKPKTDPELLKARALTRTKFEALANKFISMTKEDLKAAVTNPNATMLELMVAKIVEQAISKGDQIRLTFILDRLIGKVPDKVEAQVTSEVLQMNEEEMIKAAEARLAEIKARRGIT